LHVYLAIPFSYLFFRRLVVAQDDNYNGLCVAIGHKAARDTVLYPRKELCRKCGSNEHIMWKSTIEAWRAICSKHEACKCKARYGLIDLPNSKDGYQGQERIKALQINLNRCRLAQEPLYQYACANRVEVVFISKLYRQLSCWYKCYGRGCIRMGHPFQWEACGERDPGQKGGICRHQGGGHNMY
jgi:hypothetical protein